jgi:hypothetical protein
VFGTSIIWQLEDQERGGNVVWSEVCLERSLSGATLTLSSEQERAQVDHSTAAIWAAAGVGLAERDREQARAQQHEAGCGQREEAVRYPIVGHEIIGSHHTPATLDAGPNSLKVSESLS